MIRLAVSTILIGLALCVVPGAALAQGDSFHHGSSTPKLDYEAFNAAATPLEDSTVGQELLAACLDAYGGEEKLATLTSLRLHLRQTRIGGAQEDVTRILAPGRHHRYTRAKESRMIDGQKAWFKNEADVMELDGGRYNAELFSYLALAMPWAARTESFDSVRYGQRAGDDLGYLYFDKGDSLLVVLGIDPESHHILSTTGVVRQGDAHYVFINEFDDFRDVDGFLMPHQVAKISMGLRVVDSVLLKAEINPDLDVNAFHPRATH